MDPIQFIRGFILFSYAFEGVKSLKIVKYTYNTLTKGLEVVKYKYNILMKGLEVVQYAYNTLIKNLRHKFHEAYIGI